MRDVMRVKALMLVLIPAFAACGCARQNVAASSVSNARAHASAVLVMNGGRVDFNNQVRPILESRCTPCHFSGGQIYERLPFDRAETIRKLGTKLFTRLKDENEQRLIREFLSQE